jgi:hypothetical protein
MIGAEREARRNLVKSIVAWVSEAIPGNKPPHIAGYNAAL